MKNNTLRVILYGLTWFLGIVSLTLAVDAALLRSKQPDILFWSGKKLLFCTGVSFLGLFALCIAQKFQPTFKSDANRSLTPEKVFIFLLGIVFLSQLKEPATTAGDLEFQMEGLHQYVRGDVNEFNSLRIPIKNGNLAEDRVEPIVWYPPGTMILLLPWLKLGVPSDWAARILMVSALACGAVGFLRLATKLNIGLVARFAFSVVLALVTLSRDGLGTSAPTSVDNIGMAGFTGVSAFVLVRKIPFSRRLGVMTSYSLGFITPFLILNHYNETRAGYDALKYNEKGGIGDTGFIDFLYGPNFSATAQASQLPFSIFAGPGFLLGGNHLATKTVQMVRQEPAFVQFFEKRKTNAHVWALILICLPLSFVTFYIFGLYSKDSHAENVLFLVCMALIPIIILAYLSLKTGFNYIIKDNYRYVIPYSLLFQALLLDVWFEKIKRNSTRATQIFFSLVLFWVIIFPNAWALKQHAKRWTSPALDSNKTHIQAWDKLQTENPAGKSITFILNGHGPRTEGLDGRLVCVPFLLNGGIESDPNGAFYHTSEPIRVIIAVEQNLSTRHKGVKQFLNKFPDIEWEINPLPNSVFPEVLYADLGYNQRQILDHAPCN
ncbi:MAG: hypothetical protein HN996_09985 [Opitutae bacterium]|nr:hypothetical protein [Opitutae bacterium]